MKKLFTLIFLTMALFTLGCGGSSAKADSKATSSKAPAKTTAAQVPANLKGKKVLVAYFTGTGTTKAAAEKLAKATGADLFEIVPEQKYTNADLNYRDSNSRSCKEHNDPSIRPAIKSKVKNLKQYDVVFVGYPIWWGEAPNIVKGFVEQSSADLTGKTVVPFCTVISSGLGNSGKNLAKCAPKAKWLDGADLTKADVAQFAAGLKL